MADHAWSTDPVRDAAVRAAEDGRSGPLPTLEDVIAQPFANSRGKCEAAVPQRELRTERVTLEITHCVPVAQWNWDAILETDRPGESVRVVDEDREAVDRVSREEGYRVLLEELLTTRNERDAAISEREEFRRSFYWSEKSGTRLVAERDAARDHADGLQSRVAELEAAQLSRSV